VERAISITPITLEMNLELLDCDEVNRKRKRALEELELLVEYLKESLSGT
jgi:hypothetical protein